MEGQKRIQKYQFNMKNVLGSGSYATVYKGKVIASSQDVAVKVIDKKLFLNAYNLKNIQSEIDIMKQVRHENIVKLYDIYQTTNNMYIVTEYCDGGDLLGELRKRKKIPQTEARKYLIEIMKGSKYLHEKGIIHRDLKPANILLKEGACKISDFGFAKSLEEQNSIMKSIVGTPLYMSPQLLKRGKYTIKSDLWSIGLIYYQMIHGSTPWPAKNQLQLINGIYSKSITYTKDISQKSKDFIKKCLQIHEDERMSWEEAFQHKLLQETKKTVLRQMLIASKEKENNCRNSNITEYSTNKTANIRKDLSQYRLKRVQALTPKGSKTPTGRNNKLKQILAFTPGRDLSENRKKYEKELTYTKK